MTHLVADTELAPERRADPRRADEFRHVLGHVPTGVAVVAAMTDAGPVGLTVGTFVSASLDPPLVGALVARSSQSWPKVAAADALCISVLGEHQEDICRRFAVSGGDKFAGLPWHPAPSGAPVIDESPAWCDGVVHAITDAGDHWFVLAEVRALGVRSAALPLVFCHGTYRRLATEPDRRH